MDLTIQLSDSVSPLSSLQQGHWFKLICGASFQHLPAIRTLAVLYTLAGADCIDAAADRAVVQAVLEGMQAAQRWTRSRSGTIPQPWLMVSLNDGADPHFRKAVIDPARCPPDCPQPCIAICPAQAIAFDGGLPQAQGVMVERCYGCGRCVPICPHHNIETLAHPAAIEQVRPLIQAGQIQALELHTQVGHEAEFAALWARLAPDLPYLSLLAISCPSHPDIVSYLTGLYHQMAPLPCPLIWQTDGRPMSGDIGDGATRATLKLGETVLRSPLPGFVQLAGGTNGHTVAKAKGLGLMRPSVQDICPKNRGEAPRYLAGIAYGSYARGLITPVQTALENQPNTTYHIEDYQHLLDQGLTLIRTLTESLKPQEFALNSAAALP